MKISVAQKQNLHAAISGNIIELRIKIKREMCKPNSTLIDIDSKLLNLESKIWREVCNVMAIDRSE